MLAYTLNRFLTGMPGEPVSSGLAVIERDMAPLDAYGGDSEPDWQELAREPCRFWWAKSAGAHSANREYVNPNRTVPVTDGFLLMKLGTDITERDRIAMIADTAGRPLIDGILEISAVVPEHDHLEVSIVRTHLGA